MKTLKIGFSKPKGRFTPVAALIRLFEGTRFSHVYVSYYSSSLERDITYEAMGSGVRFLGSHYFKQTVEVIEEYTYEIEDKAARQTVRYMIDQSGKKYSKKQILGLALMRICKFLRIKIKNPFKDGAYSQICVEAAGLVLKGATGLELPGNIEDWGLTEMHDFVKKSGQRIK